MLPKFVVGQTVRWRLQAKAGLVVAVVAPGERADIPGAGRPRNHESYVVEVAQGPNAKPKRYWPLVSNLHQATLSEAGAALQPVRESTTDWTKEEILKAGDALIKEYGSLQAHPIILQCRVNALRDALEMALPLLKEEKAVCERSFLPNPNCEEEEILTKYTDVIEVAERALARKPK